MARTLDDVLHYFVPEAGPPPGPSEAPGAAPEPKPAVGPARRSIVALPVGERDVVRASLAWNLGVEAARLGAGVTILAASDSDPSLLWPEAGSGPLGAQLALSFARSVGEIARAAADVAETRASERPDGVEIVLAHVPPGWLGAPGSTTSLVDRVHLFSSPDRRDLCETYALAKRALASAPGARLGLTLYGVGSVAEAEAAFLRFAGACERHLVRSVSSFGLVPGDLHLYRSIVSRRPIGLSHPRSAAARALGAVARLLVADVAEQPG